MTVFVTVDLMMVSLSDVELAAADPDRPCRSGASAAMRRFVLCFDSPSHCTEQCLTQQT